MKTRLKVALILLMTVITACGSNASADTDTSSTEGAIIDATSATQPDPVPVSFNDGLASLNSYRLAVAFTSTGPDPAQSSTTIIESQRSSDTDASATRVTIAGPDGEPSETSDTTTYDIGNSQCTGSDLEGWEWTDINPAEAEMQGLVARMIGMTPVIDDPTFVAAETVNGVPTNHFSFQVDGLGTSSGSIVNINQGDYWLAVDGQYIVRYLLTIEMSADPNSVFHEEISIEMSDINQSVSIAFPQGCLDVAPPPTATP
jgi:hypothetical protein